MHYIEKAIDVIYTRWRFLPCCISLPLFWYLSPILDTFWPCNVRKVFDDYWPIIIPTTNYLFVLLSLLFIFDLLGRGINYYRNWANVKLKRREEADERHKMEQKIAVIQDDSESIMSLNRIMYAPHNHFIVAVDPSDTKLSKFITDLFSSGIASKQQQLTWPLTRTATNQIEPTKVITILIDVNVKTCYKKYYPFQPGRSNITDAFKL